ncbi:hypothetical protein [Candidatus Nitrotoga sp. 1052]|uniref:hypothetical protein n=1 Tax=Candidatus Nitrotoga sp. 1052 TaxID=2886964 RepID=UPI001EF72FD0|nr:hypothetical protein [Candidatus Nitrotoga sp. 1052]
MTLTKPAVFRIETRVQCGVLRHCLEILRHAAIIQPRGMLRIINLFDKHQSKENSKHVSRVMKENARQGCINGSKPPFGYQATTYDKNRALFRCR